MELLNYLNSIYDSDHLNDYEYGKIVLESADLKDSDKELLELILDIIRLQENYWEKKNVFSQFNSKRLPDINTITRTDLIPLISLDFSAVPLAIRARITDFLWTTIKEPEAGRIAIQSYLSLYECLWDEEDWTECIDAIYRAVHIAYSINNKGMEYKECIKATINGLDRTKGNDHLYLSSSLLELLAEQKYKFNSDIEKYARNAIEAAKRDNNPEKARIVLETLVKMDSKNANQYYEEAGDILVAFAYNSAIRRVQMLQQALQYYQKAKSEAKLANCRELLKEAESHILKEMQLIQTETIDIAPVIKKVQDKMQKTENLKQAIIIFGDFTQIHKRDELLDYVLNKSGITSLFSSVRVDAKGRQLCTIPHLQINEELNIDNETVQAHMFDKARLLQERNARLVLQYVLFELNKKYQYSEDDLEFLVNNNMIIPKGREAVIRKGLYLGLQGELYLALHILVPQFEHIIRFLVEMCGGKTYYYNQNGNVEERLLGSLLEDKELNEVYDSDVLFCFRGLLDKKEGSNLRNKIAHGLLEPGNSSIELYFLGLIIRFLSWYSGECREERREMKKSN